MINSNNYMLDVLTHTAFIETIQMDWKFNTYGVNKDLVMRASVDEVFDFFESRYANYRVFNGSVIVFWDSDSTVMFRGVLQEKFVNKRTDLDLTITGRKSTVIDVMKQFDSAFDDVIIKDHDNVEMIIETRNGLSEVRLPIKTNRKFIPEMYPQIENPLQFIDDFINSTANVLILTGEPGMGKSALINHIVLTAQVPTQVVYDVNVMKNDELYTTFINKALRNNGGMMIMEDADVILSDRTSTINETMSRLLNMSDGIVDTSGAKFVFSANLSGKHDIDSALVRPGRCYDIVEFKPFTYQQAKTAADAIGIELFDDTRDSYTVAELYNRKATTKTKNKVGFI